MIKIEVNLIKPGCADGKYILKAKGFVLAVLNWGNQSGPLDKWTSFAYVPVDPAGNGSFCFSGARRIPAEATHIFARFISSDFLHHEDVLVEIPEKFLDDFPPNENTQKFSVLTDLHLASKPYRVKRALESAQSENIILLGDMTNDGTQEQFQQFEKCIDDTIPEKIFLPVTGNHDVLHTSKGENTDGCKNYFDFQERMLTKTCKKGFQISLDPDSKAYSVRIGSIEILGLQCVTSGRKFSFPEGRQINWLKERLQSKSSWHLILCHAPLLAHNPNRSNGNPYLAKDKVLQEMIDNHGRIIFISGHTHVSPNLMRGNAEYDDTHTNIYLDCGSVVDTDFSGEETIMSSDWNDGCITELSVTDDEIEICMRSIKTGKNFSRGYYHFKINEKLSVY